MIELSEDDFIGLVGDIEMCFDRSKALDILAKHIEGSDADRVIEDIMDELGAMVEEKLGDYIDILEE